jgi:hypothetical protein
MAALVEKKLFFGPQIMRIIALRAAATTVCFTDKFAYGGSILSSSQFQLQPQQSLKTTLGSKLTQK